MATFHRGQNEALKALIADLFIHESGYFGPWEGTTVEVFQSQIFKAAPWKEYLSELDVLRALFFCIYRFHDRVPNGYSGLLSGIPDKTLLPDIETAIREYFESIPRPYFLFFPLPQWPTLGVAELKLNDGLSLIDTSVNDDSQIEKIRTNRLADLALAQEQTIRSLEAGQRYLRLSAFGYCYSSMESLPVASALVDLKQFLFFGITNKLFHSRPHPLTKPPFPFHERARSVFVRHRNIDEGEEFSIDLHVEIATYLHQLRIEESQLRIWQSTGNTILGGKFVAPETQKEITEAIAIALADAASFINLQKDDEDIERVRTAIQWYMDAETTQNQAISFLQRCIGLEALLGANDESRERGVTDRLSDRFAYLLGRTQSEREQLKIDFTEIYRKRSDIVHSRLSRLKPMDYNASMRAEHMLQISCKKEINSLLKLKKHSS